AVGSVHPQQGISHQSVQGTRDGQPTTGAGVFPGRPESNRPADGGVRQLRGPGNVTFDKARIPVNTQGDMISAAATFDAAGEYLLRVQANDESGEGGF